MRGLAVAEFDPRRLGNLEAWYDASFPGGWSQPRPADGAALSTWADLSGHGRDLTQATAAAQPTWQASPRGVLFDGVDDWLGTVFGTNYPYPLTSYVVATLLSSTQPGVGSNAALMDGINDDGRMFFGTSNFPNGRSWSWYGSTQARLSPGDGIDTDVHVNTTVWDGSLSTMDRDGGTLAVSGNPGSSLIAGLHVGADRNGGSWMAVTISALLIFSTVHDAATRRQVEQWLALRCGVQLATP